MSLSILSGSPLETPMSLNFDDEISENSENEEDDTNNNNYDTPTSELKSPPAVQRAVPDSRGIYMKACKKLAIGPQQRILLELASPRVALPNRHLGQKDMVALATALVKNTEVKQLEIEGNYLGPEGFLPIADLLTENGQIKYLNASHNDLAYKGAKLLAHLLQVNKDITHLHIAGNVFDERCGEVLAKALKNNRSVIELNLSHNELRENGAARIGGALAHNYTLQTLDLSWNNIRRIGGVILCKGLAANRCLTSVDLSWNGLGYDGSVALGALLKDNPTLKELNVSHNRIDWEGAKLVANGLRDNQTLRVLKIGNNPLTTTGCMDLLESISSSGCGLRMLGLDNVPVIAAFEHLAFMINKSREFSYKHGGVVNSHDVLGQRHERRLEPMQVLINYMNERYIRPSELFRIMDKDVDAMMTEDEFIQRLKMEGFKLPDYEIRQIAELFIQHKTDSKNQQEKGTSITYKKMVHGVRHQIARERDIRITQRERQQRLERYHKKILATEEPDNPENQSPDIDGAELRLPDINAKQQTQAPMATTSKGILSMTTKLGGDNKSKRSKSKVKKKKVKGNKRL